jgi:hypothetical protein
MNINEQLTVLYLYKNYYYQGYLIAVAVCTYCLHVSSTIVLMVDRCLSPMYPVSLPLNNLLDVVDQVLLMVNYFSKNPVLETPDQTK